MVTGDSVVGEKKGTTEHKDLPDLLEFMALMRSGQEAERTQVARRLHDEVGQALAAFRMECYSLEARLPQIAHELQAIVPMLDNAISVVREVSEDLRPGILGLGIEAAIEWQAEQFQTQSDIACVVDVETDQGMLDPARATELFRIFQQALANIRFHPGVTTVDLKLRQEGADFVLEIRDDGRSPGAEQSAEYALGLLTMKERAQRAGGVFAITGSTIEVRLPLGE